MPSDCITSGFNNAVEYGIMDNKFATCFGFTEEEVEDACETYGAGDQFEEVKRWYNGYMFEGQDMYNPWSIVRFLDERRFSEYWVDTGNADIVQDIFVKGSFALKNDIAGLLTDIPIKMHYFEHVFYPVIYEGNDIFWSMLLNYGYIKPCAGSTGDRFYAELVNREVRNIFAKYQGEVAMAF